MSKPSRTLTLAAVALEGIGQCALQLVTVWSALASFHQALEVVIEQAIRLQDLIQVDTIVLSGVLLGIDDADNDQGEDD